MDRYAYILEKLRESDFRRLRGFDSAAGASFSTWLVVACRRLCLDFHRSRYGRVRVSATSDSAASLRAIRRALENASSDVEADSISDSSPSVDAQTMVDERNAILCSELRRLTPRERLMIALRYQDDLPASRIAEIIGLPSPFHVYRQLDGTLAKLRRALETRGIDNSAE